MLLAAEDLAAAIEAAQDVVVLDVRWQLGRTDGRERYLAGHVPGAVFVDLEAELSGTPSPQVGRHPLPEAAELQASLRRWGVRTTSAVVAYDDTGLQAAARAWWLLRWAGLTDVRLLDGGWQAWTRAGLPVEAGEVVPEPGDAVVRPGGMPVLDAGGAAAVAASGVLLDARAAERYRGEVEPVDPRAGHVPGAVSAPTADNLRPDGRFRTASELTRRYRELGVRGGVPVGVYCGSGVTAAHDVAALELAGVRAALYAGSWSQWSNDPGRPVETG